jgi:hypothetical protein
MFSNCQVVIEAVIWAIYKNVEPNKFKHIDESIEALTYNRHIQNKYE